MPSVSVLVPAYQAQGFISETLNSLSKQVFRDFQVLISIDKSDDDTKKIVKNWSQNNKHIPTRIFCQTQRLGWVMNMNFLLEKCKTKYFMIMPNDDILDKTYLQKMAQCLKDNPQACTAFSDIMSFHDASLRSRLVKKIFEDSGLLKSRLVRKVFEKIHLRTRIYAQGSIRGKQFERIQEFLINHYISLAFTGLVNREMITDLLLIPENDYSNFGNDNIWSLQLALKGELIRVPEVLYHKRIHADNVHVQWMKGDMTKLWMENCIDCLKIIFRQEFKREEFERLIEATKKRLVEAVCSKSCVNLNKKERASLVETFEKRIAALSEAENKLSLQF